MSDEGPDEPGLAAEWGEELAQQSTRERVYAVALQLYEPTRVHEVAERADVSKETARTYLEWFAELGVLMQQSDSPARFERNEQYFEWRRVQRLQSKAEEELQERLTDLTEQERAYRERFGVSDPEEVEALEHADYDDVEAVWQAVQEWRTVRRRIRELEQARQHRDGDSRASA